MSIYHFDSTYTPAKRGGKKVSYQGCKKSKTTDTLWLIDANGLVVGFFPPMSGKKNDLFNTQSHMESLVKVLEKSEIILNRLFLNADAGFDSVNFRSTCERFGIMPNIPRNFCRASHLVDDDVYFDKLIHQERYIVERSNAWMNVNRSLLNRFDTTIESRTS